MTKTEIHDYLIKYLEKKDIHLVVEEDRLIWLYEKHYSKFKIRFHIENEETYIIKYCSNTSIKGINRRRTKVNGSYGLSVYKNLQSFKPQLDKIAEETKINTDTKTKYCTELELHYEKIHDHVNISVNNNENGSVTILVSAYDDNKNTYYNILYMDNRYYLNSKIEDFDSFKMKQNLLETA